MIYVSRPYLPKLSEYNKYLKKIWKSNWLTNDGELVKELEKKLQDFWKVKHVVCVTNGTTAIEIALKALDIKKEIYVSPFSFVSTVSAPLWLGIKPKFIDFGEEFKGPCLVTHVYGDSHLVNVSPVIYDASHAFFTKYNGKYIVNYGDVSVISFHATKVFHSVEGGAVITNNDKIAEKARYMRNFGYKNQYSFQGVGINAKMSEFHAVMGLCNLKLAYKVIKRYNEIADRYDKGLSYFRLENMTYYPIYFQSEGKLKKAVKVFNKHNIYPRRYFYPSLNKVFKGKKCPIAEDFAKKVLCLPMYYDLQDKEIDLIIKLIDKKDLA